MRLTARRAEQWRSASTVSNVQRNAGGTLGSTAQAIRNLLEAICLADEVGLDYFGVGEHHTQTMPVNKSQ